MLLNESIRMNNYIHVKVLGDLILGSIYYAKSGPITTPPQSQSKTQT